MTPAALIFYFLFTKCLSNKRAILLQNHLKTRMSFDQLPSDLQRDFIEFSLNFLTQILQIREEVTPFPDPVPIDAIVNKLKEAKEKEEEYLRTQKGLFEAKQKEEEE